MTLSVKERLQFHRDCLEDKRFPVVFCARCGSTYIDQNFIDELRCYTCGNTLKWDGTKFSINRYATEVDERERLNDAVTMFKRNGGE